LRHPQPRPIGCLGPSLQYWIGDRAFVGGALGVAVATGTIVDSEWGVGGSLRAGYSVYARGHHALHVAVEVVHGDFLHDLATDGVGLQLGWQLL